MGILLGGVGRSSGDAFASFAALKLGYGYRPADGMWAETAGTKLTPAALPNNPVGDWSATQGLAGDVRAPSDAARPTRQDVGGAACVRSNGIAHRMANAAISIGAAYSVAIRVALKAAGTFPTLVQWGTGARYVAFRCNSTARTPQYLISGVTNLTGATPLTLDQKYTVAFRSDGTNRELLIDGTQVDTEVIVAAAPATPTGLSFFSSAAGAEFGAYDLYGIMVIPSYLTGADWTGFQSLVASL